MMSYFLCRIGYFLAIMLPRKFFYGLACFTADIYWMFVPKDRSEVKNNLRTIVGPSFSDKKLEKMARNVCRNFAKYLADFLSISRIDEDFMMKYVWVTGRYNLDAALARKKGVILLSAHLGNWELGGSVLSRMGYPLNVVALTHRDKKMNDFFIRQRVVGKMKPIEIGLSLRMCYRVLKRNGLVALLGDVGFTKNSLAVNFFGNKRLFPKGPAVLSYRLGSAVIPSFMVRDEDEFRLILESPIYPNRSINEETAVMELTQKYVSRLESYIGLYPDQWCIFENMWKQDNSRMMLNYRIGSDNASFK